MLLFSSFILALAFSLDAQNPKNLKGEFGLQVTGSVAVNPVQTYSVSAMPFYKLTPKFSVGIGTGLIYTNHLGDSRFDYFSVPLYADLKYTFTNSKVSPYIEIQRGMNLGLTMVKDNYYANFGSNYSSMLFGITDRRFDFSLGFMSYDFVEHPAVDGETFFNISTQPCLVVHYAYNFKLSDKYAKVQPEKEYDTDGALNKKLNLLCSAQLGMLAPIISLSEFSLPLNMSAGLMAEYRFNTMLSVGLGADIHATSCVTILDINLDDDKQRFCSLPVYGNFRVTFGKGKVKPFYDLRVGYAFALNTLKVREFMTFTEPVFGEAQTKGLYTSNALGFSLGHSDFSLGFSTVGWQGKVGHKDFNRPYPHFFIRYSYRIGILE